jgi:hypothetical protein
MKIYKNLKKCPHCGEKTHHYIHGRGETRLVDVWPGSHHKLMCPRFVYADTELYLALAALAGK